MPDHDDSIEVTPVEEAVKQRWFLEALNATDSFDALLFLAHMVRVSHHRTTAIA